VAEATGARPDPAATTPAGRGPAFRYFDGDEQAKAFGLFQILGEDGSCHDDDVSGIDQALARRLLHGMLYIRVVDARMMALQRQGRIGFYGEAMGQEAAVVGSAAVLGPEDWIVPALREAGAGLLHGMPLSRYIAQIFGNADDVSKGRQMPCHPCDRDSHYVVMSSCVSTQIPHAVGVAMGMKLSGDRGRLCIGYMGDGGTSEGDFHVALNFAGVTQAPVVLVCQNNQWAISTPGSAQTAAPTIAAKGLGYGLESLRVDGNDVFAVYEAVKYAADKARSGGGPTFLELLTYRVSAHSSSDDPSRYRDESVTEEWKRRRDPLVRLEAFMLQRGWLAGGEVERLSGEIEAEVRAEIARQELVGPPEHRTLFEDVYEQPTWLQREQEQALDAQLEAQLRARTTSQGE
jgi:pyruvate dehydrogenase E1 component alpha subunit/2-oxoisovalerate dehydrogenase E1 component alpha subunit